MKLMPHSRIGRWSLVFLGVFVAGLAGLLVATAAGQSGGDSFTDNWWLAAPALLAVIGAGAALATALVTIVAHVDRSVTVVVSASVGLFVLLFLMGEVVVPR
jgi:hypothetical protein